MCDAFFLSLSFPLGPTKKRISRKELQNRWVEEVANQTGLTKKTSREAEV